MPLDLKILLTNDDDSAFARAYPDDGQKVATLLRALRPGWRCEVIDLPAGQRLASLDGVDGVVVTGSPASVNDERLPWLAHLLQALRDFAERRTPTVGLCFGHQAFAKALGGRVDAHTGGWGLGLGLTHWHSPAPWMSPPADRTWLMAAHREQVTLMPPGARCLGSSEVCPVASMAVGDHVFTTQFHPEMTRPFMADLLRDLEGEVPAETLERAHRSLADQRESSALFAQWMVRFLERDFAGADDRSTR
jgi:GMP synthase-like glutamine amidotransferase